MADVGASTAATATPARHDGQPDQNLQDAIEALAQRENEVETLRSQLKEILHINHKWDEEYRELKSLYESCTSGAGSESEIGQLQRDKRILHEQLKAAKVDKEKAERKLSDLKTKYEHLKRQYSETVMQLKRDSPPTSPPPDGNSSSSYQRKIKELEEERMLLTSQLQAYKEDFQAEKNDRERLLSERETYKLRYEADIASLKIQLDRTTNDMIRYKSEAARLGQQLRLKQQKEDEEYRKHLESQGYSPRKPLPPLDPYVEKDIHSHYYSQSNPSLTTPTPTPPSRRLSLNYHTHMSSSGHPVRYRSAPVRRTSTPSFSYNATAHVEPRPRNHDDDEHQSLRSVSPQIHRFGNLRLYSRESDPEMSIPADLQLDNSYIPNNLDTSYQQTTSHRVEVDIDESAAASFNSGRGGTSTGDSGVDQCMRRRSGLGPVMSTSSAPDLFSARGNILGHSSL